MFRKHRSCFDDSNLPHGYHVHGVYLFKVKIGWKGAVVMLKIAITQMDIKWEDSSVNKKKCLEMIERASSQQADIIIFPEMSLTGFSMNVDKIADNRGQTIHFFSGAAKTNGISIGFGYVTKPDDKGRNHFAIVDENGTVLMDYIKIHPFTYGGESVAYASGDKLGTFRIKDHWKCAGFICYDLRFPECFQKLGDTDAIFIIANWPEQRVRQWEALLQARAIEMQCYVAGVNRIGKGDGLVYTESSVVYNPMGERMSSDIVLNGEIHYVELDLQTRRQYVENFPVRRDRRQGIDYV